MTLSAAFAQTWTSPVSHADGRSGGVWGESSKTFLCQMSRKFHHDRRTATYRAAQLGHLNSWPTALGGGGSHECLIQLTPRGLFSPTDPSCQISAVAGRDDGGRSPVRASLRAKSGAPRGDAHG